MLGQEGGNHLRQATEQKIGGYYISGSIALKSAINLFAYVRNNAVNLIDIFGLECGVVVYRTKAMIRSLSSNTNAGHQWIEYSGGNGSIGFWPIRDWKVLSPDPCVTDSCPKDYIYIYDTKRKKEGTG